MAFLYPRTVAISRPRPRAGAAAVGRQGYGGDSKADEIGLFAGIPASIQYSGVSRGGGAGGSAGGLPSDVKAMTDYKVYIPARAGLSFGAVTERDIVTDDLGKRYQVFSALPNPLGTVLRASLLEV